MPLNKANATAAAITAGETFQVRPVFDDQPRVVTVAEDLGAALYEAGVRQRWDDLSYSRQRERVESVEGAKRIETRQRRIRQIVEQLSG